MSRAAFIEPFLSPGDRGSLADELTSILRGTADQRHQFLSAAEALVDCYRKLGVPSAQERRLWREEHFKQIAEAGQAFAAALRGMGDDARDIVESSTPQFPPRRDLDIADWVDATSRAAERFYNNMRTQRTPATHPALATLMIDLAVVYETIFGKRPSAARESIFMRATAAILIKCGAPEIGETAARSILNRAPLRESASPRGRKPRYAIAPK